MPAIYDQPSWIYDQSGVIYDQQLATLSTLGIGCRIKAKTTQTLQVQCRVRTNPTQTFTCRAEIIKRVTQQISMRVWFSRQQGFPVIDPSNPAFPLFQPTQLILKSAIINTIRANAQTIEINTRISPRHAHSFTSQCRINHSGRIQIQANIVPRIKTTTVLGVFDIQGPLQTIILGMFDISGLYSLASIGIGTRIVRMATKHVIGHFTIPAHPSTGPVNSISTNSTQSSRAIVGMGAFIS